MGQLTDAPRRWTIEYPPRSVEYIDAFRQAYFGYEEVASELHQVFQTHGPIRRICELGSGTGANLRALATYGYECCGIELDADSVHLARQRSGPWGPTFQQVDFFEELPEETFDATVVLFVPLSSNDLRELMMRAARRVRPGGLIAVMLLIETETDPDGGLQRAAFPETVEVPSELLVRFNFYEKRGLSMSFRGIYLIGDTDGTRMFEDRDRFELLPDGAHLSLPKERFELLQRLRLEGLPGQAPPFTHEVIDIYRVGDSRS